MDAVTLTAQTNQHFVLTYESTYVATLILDYPNANWRMQARTKASDVNIVYQWTSAGIVNPIFDGTIAAASNGLTILAPQADIAPLAGSYVYDIRLEDPASNACIVAVSGSLNIIQGVSSVVPAIGTPEPTLIPTVVFQQSGSFASNLTFAGAIMLLGGTWDASANLTTPLLGSGTPGPLQSSVGEIGQFWEVSNAGTTALDGINSWGVGDFAWFDGASWQKLIGSTASLSFSQITGSVSPSQLPTPTASTLGGVISATAPTNDFMTGIDTTGTPIFAQPAAANIAGLAASATTNTTNASNITSGTLPIAQLPGGIWVPIETSTSGATSVSWSGYNEIEIILENLTLSANGTLNMQFNTGSGYASSGYLNAGYGVVGIGAAGIYPVSSTTAVTFGNATYTIIGANGVSGKVNVYGVGGSKVRCIYQIGYDYTTYTVWQSGTGVLSGGPVIGAQFTPSTGSVNGGTLRISGRT